MAKAALITGGNGITGSAILEYLAKKTTEEQWSKIIVTSRSPFKTTVSDPRIEFVALDFSQNAAALAPKMKDLCKETTHAFFSSYVHKDDFAELNTANRALFENFLEALLQVAPDLENVTLQTGGKYYNVHLHPVPWPCREEDPRHVASIDNFYFPQEDFLAEKQRGQKWSYNIVRPEAIIGSTNKPNGMNEALTIAIYFLVCKELGTPAPMPTNKLYWQGAEAVSHSKLIADLSVFAATNPRCANEAFNVNNGDIFCWRYMWPRLAAYFGVEASSSQSFLKEIKEGDVGLDVSLAEWSKGKREVWDRLCDKAGLPQAKATFEFGTFAFQDWVFGRSWSSPLGVNKARDFGWTGSLDSYKGFIETFEVFKQHSMIP